MALERLQKIIAAAGIASRRKAEELILSGLVSVNGSTVTELGSKADPDTDSIRVNDKLLKGAERHEYIALNKPRGYVTTVSDPEGRPTVMELVRTKARLYPIGRLDFNSEGLLLLTNDGELAHKLMKAASHVPKTYLVKVAGQPGEEQLRRVRAGVSIIEERAPNRRVRTAPAQVRVIKEADNPWLEVTLHEGRNRQIRKMFEEIGHHVEKIRRVRYGPLELDIPPGESRALTVREIAQLQRATEPQVRPRFDDRGSNRFREQRPGAPREQFSQRERPRPDRVEAKPGFANRPPTEDRRQQGGGFSGRPPRADRGAARAGFSRPKRDSYQRPAGDRREERPRFAGRPDRTKQEGGRPAFGARRQGEDRGRRRFDRQGSAERNERRAKFAGRKAAGDVREGRRQFSDRPRREQSDRGSFKTRPNDAEAGQRFERPDGQGKPPKRKFESRGEDRRSKRSFQGPGESSGRGPQFSPRGRNSGARPASNRQRSRGDQRRPGNVRGRS